MDTVEADLRRFGATDIVLPAWMRDEPKDDAFDVLPENWEAVSLFMACSSQWNRDAQGVIRGLRYEGVDVVIRRSKVADPDDVFTRICVIERAALPVLHRHAMQAIEASKRKR